MRYTRTFIGPDESKRTLSHSASNRHGMGSALQMHSSLYDPSSRLRPILPSVGESASGGVNMREGLSTSKAMYFEGMWIRSELFTHGEVLIGSVRVRHGPDWTLGQPRLTLISHGLLCFPVLAEFACKE